MVGIGCARLNGLSELKSLMLSSRPTATTISADKMWAANLKHGVQYTRVQRQNPGAEITRTRFEISAKDIAERSRCCGASSVYRWTKEHRETIKSKNVTTEIQRLAR